MAKRLYLTQELIPVSEMTDEQHESIRLHRSWPVRYRVQTLVNACEPRIGSVLTQAACDELCLDPDWHVQITA